MPRPLPPSAAGALAIAVLLLALSGLVAAAPEARAQASKSTYLRGPIVPPEAGGKAAAAASLRRAISSGSDVNAPSQAQTSSNISGDQSVGLNNSIGDVGAPQYPPLGGMGDEEGVITAKEPVAAVATVPIGSSFGVGGQPTQSQAQLTVAQAAQGITAIKEEAPLPPGVPAGGVVNPKLDPYAPIGTEIGSFLLYSQLTSNVIATDNVLSTNINPKSDWAPELIPDFRLDSNWGRHFLSFDFNADRSWYRTYSIEDADNYQALTKGRIDITDRDHGYFELEKSETQIGRNGEVLQDANIGHSKENEEHAIAGYAHTFNRLTLSAAGTIAKYDYSDVLLINGQPAPDDDQNYTERDLELRGSYELKPGLTTFVSSTLNDREFAVTYDPVSGVKRNNNGYNLLAGANFKLGGKITGELSLGYGEQDPTDNRVETVNAFLLNANILYQVTALTSIGFQARTDIDETSLTDSAGALTRFYGATITHNLRDNLIIGGYVTYETADYVGQNLQDQQTREGATLEYLLNRNVAVVGEFSHTDYTSDFEAANYNANMVTVGLRLRR